MNYKFISILNTFLVNKSGDSIIINPTNKEMRYMLKRMLDPDCRYYINEGFDFSVASKGDTLFSLWTIFKVLHRDKFPEAYISKDPEFLEYLIHDYTFEDSSKFHGLQEIVNELSDLIDVYYTPGNFILSDLYPKMNTDRYYRNNDRIDLTLHALLKGYKGVTREELIEFIKKNQLEVFFRGGIIREDTLLYLSKSSSKVGDFSREEVLDYVKEAVRVINIRNDVIRKQKEVL